MIGDVVHREKSTYAALEVLEVEGGYRFTVKAATRGEEVYSNSWGCSNKWRTINAGKNSYREALRIVSRIENRAAAFRRYNRR